MSHFERHGSADEVLRGRRNKADPQDDGDSQPEEGVIAFGLQQVLMAVTNLMREHQQDMFTQQKQQFAHLMETLMMARSGA